MTPADLDLIETDVILDALYRRFDGGVLFVGVQNKSVKGGDINIQTKGGRALALGLAAYADTALRAKIEREWM